MHLCDNAIVRPRGDAEKIDTKPSCEITGCGAKTCRYEVHAIHRANSLRTLVRIPPLTSLEFLSSPCANRHGIITSKAIKIFRIKFALLKEWSSSWFVEKKHFPFWGERGAA
jgi:hypothetical protein